MFICSLEMGEEHPEMAHYREIPASHPLHRFFRALTESTFLSELGIGDPGLVGYVATLLAEFVPSDSVYRIRDADGKRLTQITEMIAEAESTSDENRRRDCHRHVGDFTLFWTGVFPESIPKLQHWASADHLVNYQVQGKRSYYLASTYEGDQAEVLRRLSVEFELCAFGLSRVRQEWERTEGHDLIVGP